MEYFEPFLFHHLAHACILGIDQNNVQTFCRKVATADVCHICLLFVRTTGKILGFEISVPSGPLGCQE